MAISPPGSPFLDRRSVVQVTTPAARRLETEKSADWHQAIFDQEKLQARASLRPDMAASIRAAQNVWLAAQDTQATAIPSSSQDVDIEAFITMLVAQASQARVQTNED